MFEEEQILTYLVVDRDSFGDSYLEWFNNCAISWTAQVQKALKFPSVAEANAVTRCLRQLASGELSVQALGEVR